MQLYSIVPNVPIPNQRVGRPPKLPFHLMKIGDSFVSPAKINVSMYNKDGKHFICRRVEDADGERFWRIWRVC